MTEKFNTAHQGCHHIPKPINLDCWRIEKNEKWNEGKGRIGEMQPYIKISLFCCTEEISILSSFRDNCRGSDREAHLWGTSSPVWETALMESPNSVLEFCWPDSPSGILCFWRLDYFWTLLNQQRHNHFSLWKWCSKLMDLSLLPNVISS